MNFALSTDVKNFGDPGSDLAHRAVYITFYFLIAREVLISAWPSPLGLYPWPKSRPRAPRVEGALAEGTGKLWDVDAAVSRLKGQPGACASGEEGAPPAAGTEILECHVLEFLSRCASFQVLWEHLGWRWGQIGMDLCARLVSSSDSAVPPGLPSFRALCYKMSWILP